MGHRNISRRAVLSAGLGTALSAVFADALTADSAFAQLNRTWRDVPLPDVGTAGRLSDIAATGARDVWLAGHDDEGPCMFRWNGRDWARHSTPDSYSMVAASGRREAWGMGGNDLAGVWDGSAWRAVDYPAAAYPPLTLTAARRETAWAIADHYKYTGYTVMRYDDGWIPQNVPVPPGGEPHVVAVRTARDVWLSGPQGSRPFTLHWNGDEWTSVQNALPDGDHRISQILPVSADLAWAWRLNGPMPGRHTLLRWTGGEAWETIAVPDWYCYDPGLADDGRGGVWLGTDMSQGHTAYLHYRNGTWTSVNGPDRAVGQWLGVAKMIRLPGTRTIWSFGTAPGKPFIEELRR